MARLRAAPSVNADVATQRTTRRALKEKTNTVQPKGTAYEFQENIEELVKPARPRRGQAKQAIRDENEFVMAGGLGEVDIQTQSRKTSDPLVTKHSSSQDDGVPAPDGKSNRRPNRMIRKAVRKEAQNNALDDLKRRMQASKTAAGIGPSPKRTVEAAPPSGVLQRTKEATRRSNGATNEHLDISISQSPLPDKLSGPADKRSSLAQPASALKSHITPAIETSILALKNFKRRSRQPSMLQMVRERTASARPSLVNTSALRDTSGYDVEDVEDDDDEEEFAPDAVGTPLHVKKTEEPRQSGATRKRKSAEADLTSSALDALRSKRHKSAEASFDDEFHVVETQSQTLSPDPQNTPQPTALSDVQVINSSPSSVPSSAPHSAVRNSFVDVNPLVPSSSSHPDQGCNRHSNADKKRDSNDIMAEPLSSSPQPSGHLMQSTADLMAQPMTQRSEPRRTDKTRRKGKLKPMTTATLQSLLPRGRKRAQPTSRKFQYDLDPESENEDQQSDNNVENEDENETSARHRKGTRSRAHPKYRKPTTTKPHPKASRSKAPSRKSTAPPKPSTRKSTARSEPSKTYARSRIVATSSDKENEDSAYVFEDLPEDDPSALPDTSISMIEAAQSAELEAARKNFAEVDDWEMDFESVSFEEGRSSSQEWR